MKTLQFAQRCVNLQFSVCLALALVQYDSITLNINMSSSKRWLPNNQIAQITKW